MVLKCRICQNYQANGKDYEAHLKIAHKLRNKYDKLYCGKEECSKHFLTFNALRNHLNTCISTKVLF